MLNLKKGLALVLAAATAFTFAPVSAFATGSVTTDGLTTKEGIDSLGYSALSVDKFTGTAGNDEYTTSRVIHLKEHNDAGDDAAHTQVGAFKITIDRKADPDTPGNYLDVVQAADSIDNTSKKEKLTNLAETTPGATIDGTTHTSRNSSGAETLPTSIAQRSYVVANTLNTDSDNDGYLDNLGGANFILYNTGVDGTVKVTIEALATKTSTTALSTSTLTVTVPSGNTSFALQKTSVDASEDSDVQVPFVITNPTQRQIQHIEFADGDNTIAAPVAYQTTSATTMTTIATTGATANVVPITSTDVYGVIKFHTGIQGQTKIKVTAWQDADHKIDQYLTINVKAGNGKLSVSYNVQTSRGAERYTFTDNAEYNGTQANNSIKSAPSIDKKVENGALKIGTKLNADKDGKLKNKNGYYIKNDGTAVAANTAADAISKRSELTTGKEDAVTEFDYELTEDLSNVYTNGGNLLPSAQTLYSDGTKTVQFDASANPGTEIRYSLVAEDEWQDTEYTAAGTNPTTVGYGSNPHTDYVLQKYVENNAGSAHVTLSGSTYGPNTKQVFSEDAAKKYGSISKNGLVTLKDANNTPQLYVVVSAIPSKAQADNGQKVSTYVVPIELSVQQPVQFYVGDSLGYVELESRESTGNVNLRTSRSDEKLYLSLASNNGRKSDKLNIVSNIGDQYVTGYSEDTSVATYDDTTHTVTAVKAGTTNIVIKTLSAPDYAGIITATIPVEVNNLDSSNGVSLKGVSVNKDKPTAKIASTPTVAGTNVVFSRALYKKDSNRPTGYSAIWPTDAGYGDIDVSSTGNVTYSKNNGTVYVRAYAQGDATHNPSTYAYVPVNYGQQAVDTELNVDTQPIVLDVKDTKQISATASTGSSISYTSADPTVASVNANGLVTANKSGYTTVTVTATAPDGKTGDSAIITVIVRGSETITDDTVKPAKVTGLKVSNKKGAHVSVKWKSQGKNINYRIWKKVGNGKWVGKNVAGSKATLSVKKGAKVQVKVKAYVKDSTGKTTWGPKATKAKTFKTDKK